MEAWQYRLIEEHEQLSYRIGKLNEYMGKANGIGQLPMQHQQLLKMQLSIMQAYEAVLSERIRLHMLPQPTKQA